MTLQMTVTTHRPLIGGRWVAGEGGEFAVIRSGTVQVNAGWASGYTPMGGYKQSGYGRERGAAGIRAFQELKHVVVSSR